MIVDCASSKTVDRYRVSVKDMIDQGANGQEIIETIKKANNDSRWAIASDQFESQIKPLLESTEVLRTLSETQTLTLNVSQSANNVINEHYSGDCDEYLDELRIQRKSVPRLIDDLPVYDDDGKLIHIPQFPVQVSKLGRILMDLQEVGEFDLSKLKDADYDEVIKLLDGILSKEELEEIKSATDLTGAYYFVGDECIFFRYNKAEGKLKYPDENGMTIKRRAKNDRWLKA